MKFAAAIALLVLESAAIIAACSLNPQPIPPGETTAADGATGAIGPVGNGGRDAGPTPTLDAAVFQDAAAPPPGRTSEAGNLDGSGAGDSTEEREGGPSEIGSTDGTALEEGTVPSEGAPQE